MDILTAASNNAPGWTARADERCLEAPQLAEFRRQCSSAVIGTNVDAAKLAFYRSLQPPRVVSSFGFLSFTHDDEESAFTALYEQGEWGPRRFAVETGIGALKTAVYGTLDLPGSAGDYRYGWFRLSYEASLESPPLVFPHNTAWVYAQNGVLDEDGIGGDVARWQERSDVCVVELGSIAEAIPETRWPTLLATERANEEPDLIEVVVRGGELPLSDVIEIRVEAERLSALLRGAVEALLHPDERGLDLAVHLASELAADDEAGLLRLVPVAGVA